MTRKRFLVLPNGDGVDPDTIESVLADGRGHHCVVLVQGDGLQSVIVCRDERSQCLLRDEIIAVVRGEFAALSEEAMNV